jgi:sugar/nucleoside kinase (ribokinase family)
VNNTAAPSVLTFGEALVGYSAREGSLASATAFSRFAGGADLNVAVALSRLGISATWASVLGVDAHGDYVAEAVRHLGITPVVRRAAGPTALMFKAGGSTGDPEVLQVRHDSAFAQHADAVLADLLPLRGHGHLHLTGIALGISAAARASAIALLEAATAAGYTTSFDPNLRLHLFPDRSAMCTLINAVAARCTVVLPGVGEGKLLTGHAEPERIADFYLNAGAAEVVVKLGAEGARAYTAEGSARAAKVSVRPVDTVGAGDGFAAGYLSARLRDATLQERVDNGALVGAFVTTRRGDLAAMPTERELLVFRTEQWRTYAQRGDAQPADMAGLPERP